VVREKTIEVNSPSVIGATRYTSPGITRRLTRSTLQVVRDPGVPVVYAGFLCMVGGLILLLCFKRPARKLSPGEPSPETETEAPA